MASQKIITDSIKDQIYQILKEEIINCKLKSGEQLIEQAIANRLNVSRSPVREAIQLLVGDGLVVNITNKGAFVKKPTPDELDEMLEMRQALEIYAINKIIPTLSNSQKNVLNSLRSEMLSCQNKADFLSSEKRFCICFISMIDNSYILNSYEKIYAMVENFNASVLSLSGSAYHPSLEERIQLIDALLAGDMSAASSQVAIHAKRTSEIVRAAIASRQQTLE